MTQPSRWPAPEWVTYQYRKAHPILRWLPTKLAEWLAENMQSELQIPPKQGAQWTVAELNTPSISEAHSILHKVFHAS